MTWLNDAVVTLPPTQQELLDEALKRGLEVQKTAANQARQLMLSPAYSELDQASFDKQEAEANLVLAGQTTGLLLLPGMASERGITLLDMANKVKQKADQFAQLTGLVLGARQRIEKQMKAAHKADDLPELERLIAVAKVEILKPLSAQA